MPAELYLVDTSVWLQGLPPGSEAEALRRRIDSLLAADAVATTGMARLELPGGAGTPREWERLQALLSALQHLPVHGQHWEEAAGGSSCIAGA